MRNLKLRLELLKITLQLGRSEMSPPLFESNALSVDCLSDEVFEVQRTDLVSHWRHCDGYMEWEKRGGERWCQDFGETTWMGVCGRWRGWQVNSGVEPGLWKEGVVQCAVGDIWNLRASFIQLIFEWLACARHSAGCWRYTEWGHHGSLP